MSALSPDDENNSLNPQDTKPSAMGAAGAPIPGERVAGVCASQIREDLSSVQDMTGGGLAATSPLAHVIWPEPSRAGAGGALPSTRGAHGQNGTALGRTETAALGDAGDGHVGMGASGSGMMLAGAERASLISRAVHLLSRLPRLALRVPILVYRYTLSSFMGRQCRYLPTCSAYADEAISRHGAWPGLFMTTARICRCHPWGGDGYDPVPQCLPVRGRWYAPWRYGLWRMPPLPVDETGEGANLVSAEKPDDI